MKVSLGTKKSSKPRYTLSSAKDLQKNTLLRCYHTASNGQESFEGFAMVSYTGGVFSFEDGVNIANNDFTFEIMDKGETVVLEQE